MTYQFDASIEGGVLKPLVPVLLPDLPHVRVTVEPAESKGASADAVAAQKAALQSLWSELDKLPQHQNNDGWSVRDHDQLLYDELQQ